MQLKILTRGLQKLDLLEFYFPASPKTRLVLKILKRGLQNPDLLKFWFAESPKTPLGFSLQLKPYASTPKPKAKVQAM